MNTRGPVEGENQAAGPVSVAVTTTPLGVVPVATLPDTVQAAGYSGPTGAGPAGAARAGLAGTTAPSATALSAESAAHSRRFRAQDTEWTMVPE